MIHRKLIDMQLAAKGRSERVFGKIIFSRADSAGEQNNIRTALCDFNSLLEAAAIVSYYGLKIDVNPHRSQLYR
ncbi:hypothetical protein D3C81_1812600 [compost metagenome]